IANYANVSNTGTGTISSGYGFYASPPANSGGGDLTSYYGLYIATPTAATNNYGVYSQGGTNYFGGNVGLGTTAPGSKLTVAGGTPEATVVATGDNCVTLFGAGNTYFQGRDVTNNIEFIMGTSTGLEAFAGSMSAHDFSLRTGNTTRVMIKNSGNVGIGTTAPTAPFHVAGGGSPGKLMVLGDGANLNGYIDMMVARGFVGYSGSTGNTVLQGGGGKGILLNVNNATFGSGTAMAIDSTGKVGVGTTAPGVILDIAGQSTLVRGTGTTPGEIRLGPGPTTGSNYVGFKGPSANPGASVLWQLPSADGTNGQLLTTNGSGVLSWSSVAGAGSSQASSTNFIFNTNSDNSGSDGGVSFQNNGADLMTVSDTGDTTITSAGSSAFSIGPNGATNPTLNIDASTVSAVTGLNITSGAAGSGVTVQATSTGANESLVIRSKGTGALTLGTNTSGGSGIILQNATSNRLTVGAATYNFTPGPAGATAARFSYTGATDSSMTAGTEANNVYFNLGQTRTHNAGAITLQRDFRIVGATHAFGGASTVSDAATFAVDGPPSGGANATLTRSSAIYVPTSTVANTTSSYGLNVTAASGATNNYAAVFMGGNVGVGTTGPTTQLQVAGVISPSADNTHDLGTAALRFKDIYAANNVIQTSDARLKTEVKDSDLGLDFINNLRPVSYYWKEGDSKLHYGVIAQETEKALGEAKKLSGRENEVDNVIVTHDTKTDRYGVRYTELIAPMIKAIQELYSEIFGIKDDIDDVRTKTASLEAENQKLKQENAAIKAYLCAKDKNASICN
ncbi:MAG: tail fiber domain-containing protein, partial [Bdellovibrionota bacterium]